jgi:hypothetical protein
MPTRAGRQAITHSPGSRVISVLQSRRDGRWLLADLPALIIHDSNALAPRRLVGELARVVTTRSAYRRPAVSWRSSIGAS